MAQPPHPKDAVDAIIEEIDRTIGRLREIPATASRDVAITHMRRLKAVAVGSRQAIANIRRWE